MSDIAALFDPGSCDRRQFLGWSAALTLGALAGHAAQETPPEVVVMVLSRCQRCAASAGGGPARSLLGLES